MLKERSGAGKARGGAVLGAAVITAALFFAALLAIASCGKKAPPRPPQEARVAKSQEAPLIFTPPFGV